MFWHEQERSLLVVYVDDFKLAGPTSSLPRVEKKIRTGVRAEEPGPISKYLGCEHIMKEVHVRPGQTPLEALSEPVPACGGPPSRDSVTVRTLVYDMSGFLRQCVDRYLELANRSRSSLRRVGTPFTDKDEGNAPEGAEVRGELANIAAKVLMKILYAARMCRFDLLRAVCALAAKVTKWTSACDAPLHRLICYINATLDVHMIAYVGD